MSYACQGHIQKKKGMTEAMSIVKLSFRVFMVLMITINSENENMIEANASICLLLATAACFILTVVC